MELKAFKFKILHGPASRLLLLRAFMVAIALSFAPLLHMLCGSGSGAFETDNPNPLLFPSGYLLSNLFLRPILNSFGSFQSKEDVNLTLSVARELMGMQMLSHGSKALFVGEGSASVVVALRDLGFPNVCGAYRHPFFSLAQKKLVYELDYEDNSFDFVLSRDLDKVSVPALLVLEIERVLRPGGIGAVVVAISGSEPNSLIRSATPVSSSLKASSIVHVGHVYDFSLVVFKKNFGTVGYFGRYNLPAQCESIINSKALMGNIEPLVEEKPLDFHSRIAYLPKFVDVASKKRLVYVDIGAGEHLNSYTTECFLPHYPVNPRAFSTYLVDHNTSVLLSFVKEPGITFVYHPGLSVNKTTVQSDAPEDLVPFMEDDGFDFLLWFKETVQYADFVVLKMNTGPVELKFLSGLFESGAICFVDELFLGCTDLEDGENILKGGCMNLFKSLRSSGVFVHQWWND